MLEVVWRKTVIRRNEARWTMLKQLAARRLEQTERNLILNLAPMFVDQVESMARELRKLASKSKSVQQAEALVHQIYDPNEWDDDLIKRTLPTLARGMAESMVAQLLELGIDVRRNRGAKRFSVGGLNDHVLRHTLHKQGFRGREAEIAVGDICAAYEHGGYDSVSALVDGWEGDDDWDGDHSRKVCEAVREWEGNKQSSATRWIEDHDGSAEMLDEMLLESGQSLGVLTEIPDWMKQDISDQLKQSYSQPYWRAINETTGGDAERVLTRGLQEGLSIRKMADEMARSFQGSTAKYARMRATNIARTEAGNALNGARKSATEKLKEEVPQVPMKQSWLSVLGDTTRSDHADLDGVPEDDQGMWRLGGIDVPWPAHYSLEPGQRCNCQCTVATEFGMEDEEARRLISEHEERLAE
jgi:hypothetical protein